MTDVYTCNTCYVRADRDDAFLAVMREVTDAATELGGAREGLVLRDIEDQTRFNVIRRWDSIEAYQRWGETAKAKALWTQTDQLVDRFEAMTATKVLDIPTG